MQGPRQLLSCADCIAWARRPTRKLAAVIHETSGDGQWSCPGCILKVQLTGFAKVLDSRCERKDARMTGRVWPEPLATWRC